MDSAERIRVLVAEDNEDLRAVIEVLVSDEPDLCCVGAVSTIAAVVEAGERLAPNVVVLDIELQGESSLKSLSRIQTACRDARVLIYSGHVHPSIVRGALEAGAAGYVTKNGDVSQLLEAIRQAGSRS